MNTDVILKIIQIALALAETGSEVETFLQGVTQRVTAAQADGTDLTASDWDFIDQEAATHLANINKLAGNA